MPEERVMHFPNAMAQHGSYLAINSSSADGKYHAGRLVVVDTSAVQQAITNNEAMSWEKIVRTNFMVPQETGEMYFSDSFVVTSGRENNELIAVPVKNGVSPCNDPSTKIEACPSASNLPLLSYDPLAIAGLEKAGDDMLVVSYLSSDRIDLVKLDKTKSKDALAVQKSLNAMDFVRTKVAADTLKNQRLLTRKIFVTAKNDPLLSKVYFLLEQHSQKMQAPTKPRFTFIVAIKTSDLIGNSALVDAKVEFWNLNDQASIAGAHDFYVDEAKNMAYVLAHIPEALYKIDLTKKDVVEVASICTGATSMAVSASDDLIVLPCFNENRVMSLSMDDLVVKATSKILGRGPSFVVIDKTTGYFFCTLSTDGIVAVLDRSLNYLGHLFDKAPLNRVGS